MRPLNVSVTVSPAVKVGSVSRTLPLASVATTVTPLLIAVLELSDGEPLDEPLSDGEPLDEPLSDGEPLDEPLSDGEPVGEPLLLEELAGVTVTAATPVDDPYALESAGVNVADRLCPPLVEKVVVVVATPPLTGTEAASTFVPSKNWTVPAATGLIVAVRVTVAPVTTFCGAAIRFVFVAVGVVGAVTVTVAAELVEAVKAVGSVGVNTAVIECEPAAANDVVALAEPPDTVTAVPTFADPSLNCTEPTASDGVTVAARATLAPVVTEGGVAVTAVVVVTAPGGGVVTVTVTAELVDAT